ncbi:MAG: hypothetical protein J6W28_06195, partial [Clostridia bacterium]|nr:hypothetical protein [Clostridia bacterium]
FVKTVINRFVSFASKREAFRAVETSAPTNGAYIAHLFTPTKKPTAEAVGLRITFSRNGPW